MTPEQKRAHERMLATLPIRNHIYEKPKYRREGYFNRNTGRFSGSRVEVNGKVYETAKQAALELGLHPQTIAKWTRKGTHGCRRLDD